MVTRLTANKLAEIGSPIYMDNTLWNASWKFHIQCWQYGTINTKSRKEELSKYDFLNKNIHTFEKVDINKI